MDSQSQTVDLQQSNQMSQHILIIGAGLAGLTLGQGLRHASVSFQIFGKDQAADFRAQGYRIRIDANGINGLKRCLPPEVFRYMEPSGSDVGPGGHRMETLTGEPEPSDPSRMPPQKGPAWNADRTVMRSVLLIDMLPHIQFSKKLERYELLEGGIIVYFADVSKAQGSMLIGADGVRSPVRKQMIPHRILLDTEGRAVFGKTIINGDIPECMPEELEAGITLVGADNEPRMKLFCDLMRFKRHVQLPAHVTLPEDYIYWVLVFHKSCGEITDLQIASSTAEESALFAERLISGWHQSVRHIVDRQLKAAASTLFFLASKPPIEHRLVDERLKLIGDSSHPMPHVGGVGANIAFQDAADLLELILGGTKVEKLARYEEVARERWNKALTMSLGGGGRFFNMKPVDQLQPVAETWS